MINVTRTYLPDFNEYASILKRAWDKRWITNNGELVQELENSLKDYLGIKHLLFTSNGTVVLQMALKALDITKEVITTPFSYVATTNAIVWEGCTPVFVDIKKKDFCIDADALEPAITENTQAIVATHVYGLPCNIEKIEAVAARYNLKVIYDGAHAFDCTYNNKSLLSYGDISTCSFHATKLFHTGEGGCIICHNEEVYNKLFLMRNFGHKLDDYYCVGINAKNSELHAAMGIAVLPRVKGIIKKNKKIFSQYTDLLKRHRVQVLEAIDGNGYNYGYFPVLFESEKVLVKVKNLLEENSVFPRRYFYPSLNTLPFLAKTNSCPVSEDLSKRVLCLPLYADLSENEVDWISSLVIKAAGE